MDRCDSSGDEYDEINEEILNIKCLFCDLHLPSHDSIFNHIQETHGIDLLYQCKKYEFDTFKYIKLINYVRKNSISPTLVDETLSSKEYENDEYLKPFLEDDHLLMFDVENDEELESSTKNGDFIQEIQYEAFQQLPKDKLLEYYINLKKEYDKQNVHVDQMRSFIRNTVDEDSTNQEQQEANSVFKLDEKSDSGYIDSYSHFSIHHVMLSDKPRTLSYQQAILENSSFFKDKSVLDIGCGTGILSLFSAQAGAKIVVAIDQSDIINNAISIIYKNGYDHVIKTVKGKLENIDFNSLKLPSKYDIIISEWMGYFLLFEGMVDTVIYARDHLLTTDGVLLPNSAKMFLSASSDKDFYEKNIKFWNNVYGFDMSSMVESIISEATIDVVKSEHICSSSELICELDISKCSMNSVQNVNSEFELKFEKDSTVYGLIGWFDCFFDLMPKSVVLSTSPFSEETHWKQTIFPFKEPIQISAGQKMLGEIKIERSAEDIRALKVSISLQKLNIKMCYNISC